MSDQTTEPTRASWVTVAFELKLTLARIAPEGEPQIVLTKISNQMCANGLTAREKAREWANMLTDGLNHGNWPWVIGS